MDCLKKIEAALREVGDNVWHYYAPPETEAPYLVWAESGQADAVYGDGRMECQAVAGTVDLFTFEESDPLFTSVQNALQAADIAWKYSSTQYERPTGLIHHEWRWEVG